MPRHGILKLQETSHLALCFSLLEWLSKRTSCFLPIHHSLHNPSPFWTPKGLFLCWMKTSDQESGRGKLERSNVSGETAPEAQSPAKWAAHGHCLATHKLHTSHSCLFPRHEGAWGSRQCSKSQTGTKSRWTWRKLEIIFFTVHAEARQRDRRLKSPGHQTLWSIFFTNF